MKRFYNNTLMSGAFSKALRVVALLCVLMGFTSSAWGETYYIDASCISGVQQISWLQYQNGGGDIVSQNTSFDGKTAFQFTADAGKTLKLQLKIVSGNTTIYPQLYDINLSGSNNCIELSLDGSTLSYKAKQGSTLKCADGCTPSATITGASYDGTNINLSGRLSQVCDSKTTFYGWQYKTSASGDWEAYIRGTGGNDNSSQTTKDYSYAWNNGGNLVAGTTYYFRAYATYDAQTWYSDDKILSVTISSTDDGNCDNIVYLKPNSNWLEANAWFAARFWEDNKEEVWKEMIAIDSDGDCSGLYYTEVPEGYTKVIFVRKNPADKTLEGWNNKWNQTVDLTVDNQLFTITGGSGDAYNGSWSTTTCTEGCTTVTGSSSLLLSSEVLIGKTSKTAQMFAYLKETGCNNYTKYGFYYCSVNDGDAACTPNGENKITIEGDALERGEEFNATLTDIEDGKTYYYRAYATTADETKTVVSNEIRSFATDPCIPQYGGLSDKYNGNPIVYTINADPAFIANDCKLYFNSLQDAIDHLKATNTKDNDFKYVTLSDGSYNLNQPVEMRVVYYDDTPDDNTSTYAYRGKSIGADESFVYSGQNKPVNANLIEDINKSGSNVNNTLCIKAGSNKAKPWIHHIVIRNSKNVVLDSLAIFSDPSGIADNALEIDVNTTQWHTLKIATCADANIVIQNSMIGSAGFTGVHVSGYDGITFKNNDFEAIFDGTDGDAVTWGASAKFMASKNIKFIQNNFRGDHACLLWLQESQNFLIMNNVFWNTNKYASTQNVSAIKLVAQFGDQHENRINLENIDIYYNTFYLADEKQDAKYNFLQLFLAPTTENSARLDQFVQDGVRFKYNNCYSYDTKTSGIGNYNPGFADFSTQFPNTCPNNFWSQYDEDEGNETSAFAFGCSNNTFTNVKTQVCETTASGPASLIVKGQAMNTGKKLTNSDFSSTGIELTANELTSDRYLIGVRPNDDTWTMGAYQSKDNIETKVIYWVGLSSDWDDRNNWEYETEVAGQMVRQRVSCVNTLSEDLKVVIEEIGTVEIQDGRKWPVVPEFEGERTNSEFDEHVSAGLGTGKTPTKFASYIKLEHGAGIIGVENLKEGETLRYDYASTELQAPLKQWMLVGPVIKPFKDGSQTEVRNVVSNDYYLERFPAVQMHGADIEGNTASWGATFPDLDKSVVAKSAYAIKLLDAFGTYKLPAEYYDMKYGTNYTDFKSHTYTFKGRFYNENALPNYEELEAGVPILLNNTYPANIDANALNTSGKGTVQLYNYSTNAFDAAPSEGTAILSQHAFVFTPAENGTLVIDNTKWFLNSITRHRSGSDVLPTCRVQVKAIRSNTASNVVLTVDELKDDEADYATDAPKIFNSLDGKNELTIPDIYVMRYNKQWSGIRIPSMDEVIPLGIRINHADAELEFSLLSQEELGDIILEDRLEGKKYNLSEGEKCYVSNLEVGDCEGRFFINLSDKPEDDTEDNTDDNISTEIEDSSSNNGISIITKENSVVISCSSDIELKTIYINDMSGKTAMFNVSGQYAEIELPVAQGVYTVNVIGDTATKTGKVILK